MEKYKNIGRGSGVSEYEIGADYIKVKFCDASTYLYSYRKPGNYLVEQMKNLAQNGVGLNSYINRNVKYKYESKLN